MATHYTLTMPRRSMSAVEWLRALLQGVARWYGRARERRALAHLDERMLRDIGISAADARREAAKPFWVR